MAVDRFSTQNKLRTHVLEIKHVRRIPKIGWSPTRRGFYTINFGLLNSPLGMQILKFRPPFYPPPYDYSAHNLLIAWDLVISLDWRTIGAESAVIIQEHRVVTIKEQQQFWSFFAQRIAPLPKMARKMIADT